MAARSAISSSGKKPSREEQAQQPKKKRPKSITDLEGVGKATAGKLEEAGIKSINALIEADAVELAKIIKVSVKKIKNWQTSCSNTVENFSVEDAAVEDATVETATVETTAVGTARNY